MRNRISIIAFIAQGCIVAGLLSVPLFARRNTLNNKETVVIVEEQTNNNINENSAK